MAKAHKNADFVLGDGCRELSTTRHEPCGVHLAAIRQATDCRNLPRNLPPRSTCRSYYRAYPRTTYLPLIPPCIPPWNYRKKLPPCATAGTPTPRATYLPGILPRDESYRAMGLAPSGRVIRM